MSKITYKPEIFDLVKNLTTIDTSVIFFKENDKICIRRADEAVTIAYQIQAPMEFFNVDQDSVAFYDYPEFYQFFKTIKDANIELNAKKIILKDDFSKLEYFLADSESIKPGPKTFKFNNPDFKIKFSSEDLDEFIRVIALVKPKKAKIYGNGKQITIKLFNNSQEHNFERVFEVENLSGIEEDIDFNIFSDTFTFVPLKHNYEISISKIGFIKISLAGEDLQLDMITSKVGN